MIVSLPAILLLGVAWLIYFATTTADAALATINRYETRKYVKGSHQARMVNHLIEQRHRLTTTSILLRVAALLGAGVALAILIYPVPAWYWFLLGAAIVWVLLALSHLLGRVWVHNNPAQAVMAVAGYMRVALWLLTPVAALLAPVTLRGIHDDDEDAIVLSSDGMRLIMPNDGDDSEIEESEKEMITSILEMDDTVAREVMVPRIDMVSLEADISFAEALDVIIGAGHSRVPVYDDYVDQIVGVLYAKDMLRCFQQGSTDMPIRTLLRPAYFVPLTKNVKNLLAEMRKHRVHIAIVVDEYGGTAGLVTIEDILEEIVGEIQDEYDAVEEILVQRVGEDSFLLSARLDLYSVAKLLDIEIEDEDADTVGGLVLGLLGHVPEAGESVVHSGWRFTVIMVEGRRIEQVRVEPVAQPDPPHEDERGATKAAGTRSESPAANKPAHNATT